MKKGERVFRVIVLIIMMAILVVVGIDWCTAGSISRKAGGDAQERQEQIGEYSKKEDNPAIIESNIEEQIETGVIPSYEEVDEPYIELNSGEPFFENSNYNGSFEYYAELDDLGRCTYAVACIGEDLMPTEGRGDISNIKPTGWVQEKYDIVDGGYIYNRCHLIGHQLTGEDDNERNLITGTRFMNIDGMIDIENEVAEYIKQTGNHVLYRVTPVFVDDELVCRGVIIEAESMEDGGGDLNECIFAYNVQPGIEIDYETGENWEAA